MILKRILISLAFLLSVLLMSALVYWVIAPKSSLPPKGETKSVSQHPPTQKTSAKSAKKPTESKTSSEETSPLPPPDVKWSEFSHQLLDLEQERVAILTFLSEKFPPPEPEIELLSSVPQEEESKSENTDFSTSKASQSNNTATVNFTETSWSTVGKQIVELERQREQTITLLGEELNKAGNVPAQFEKIK